MELVYSDPERIIEEYAEFIYWFPKRVLGESEENCGEFFEYATEKIRDKASKPTWYRSGMGAEFKTFLSKVLRNLYLDLLRSKKRKSVRVRPLSDSELKSVEAEDETKITSIRSEASLDELWTDTDPAKRHLRNFPIDAIIHFKLMYLVEFQFSDEEISYIARASGRTIPETTAMIRKTEEDVLGRFSVSGEVELRAKLGAGYIKILGIKVAMREVESEIVAYGQGVPGYLREEFDALARSHAELIDRQTRMLCEYRGRHGLYGVSVSHAAKILNISPNAFTTRIARYRKKFA
ncbi:MAG: hypothetical protein NUW37_20205 [Planctomycetes bacterium]|nr:hypothetical protein [Planctomycetota bacterium]